MQTVSRLAVQKKLYESSQAEYKKLESQRKQYEEAKAEYEAAIKQREEEQNKTEPVLKINSVQLLLETRLSKKFAQELEKHEIELKYRKMLTRKRYDYCANYVAQNYMFVFG